MLMLQAFAEQRLLQELKALSLLKTIEDGTKVWCRHAGVDICAVSSRC